MKGNHEFPDQYGIFWSKDTYAKDIPYHPFWNNKDKIEILNDNETKEEKQLRLIQQEIEIAKAKGLKEFIYGENKLYSINQKNADKKAKKYGWI